MSLPKKYLIVVAGPTAAGKTQAAIRLAQHYGTDIISTDSRQFYREMHIGTAKPTPAERQAATHHLIDFLSVTQSYDVKQFEQDALRVLQDIFTRHHIAIATGGSGLYIQTLCRGLDAIPDVPDDIRRKWNTRLQEEGLAKLAALLQNIDPDYYRQADVQNPRRVLRALGVYEATGTPFSAFRQDHIEQSRSPRDFHTLKIGLRRDRDELYERINRRVDEMMDNGLLEEACALYPFRSLNALQTVGYQELFSLLEGKYDLAEAIRLIKRNTRRLAKRQMTWFRKDTDIRWFDLTGQLEPQVLSEMVAYLKLFHSGYDEMI